MSRAETGKSSVRRRTTSDRRHSPDRDREARYARRIPSCVGRAQAPVERETVVVRIGGTFLVAVSVLMAAPDHVGAHQRVLRMGSTGVEVLAWQEALRLSGTSIAREGIFGQETLAATRGFQRQSASGLAVDGIVNFEDIRAWIGASVACCGAGHPESARGAVGSGVGWLQISLNRWLREHSPGYPTLSVDMVFGMETEAALQRFQSANGLVPTGAAGQRTWKRLARDGFAHLP